MRLRLKKIWLCVIASALLACAAIFGAGCALLGGIGGGNSVEPSSENTANIRFDAESASFVWDHDERAGRYELLAETEDGEPLLIDTEKVEEPPQDGKIVCYANSEMKRFEAEIGDGFYALLTAYGDSYEDELWTIRIPFTFLSPPKNIRASAQSGVLEWDGATGAAGYLVNIYSEPLVLEQPCVDLSQYVKNLAVGMTRLQITPFGQENGTWATYRSSEFFVTAAPTVEDLFYRDGNIRWYTSSDGYAQSQGVSFDFTLTVTDGERTLTENGITNKSYAYTPQTDEFSFSVQTAGKNENGVLYLSSQTAQHTPTYLGTAQNFAYSQSTHTLSWDGMDGVSRYDIYVNGEMLLSQAGTQFSATEFGSTYGEKALEIFAFSNQKEGYYLPLQTSVYAAKTPTLALELAENEEIRLTVTDIDERATGLRVTYTRSLTEISTENYAVTDGTFNTAITLPETDFDSSTTYTIVVAPVLEGDVTVVGKNGRCWIGRSSAPTAQKITVYQGKTCLTVGSAYASFEAEINGVLSKAVDGRVQLPDWFVGATEKTDLTVKVRRAAAVNNTSLYLPSKWQICTVKNPGQVQSLRVENGVAYWEYQEDIQTKYKIGDYTVNGTSWDIAYSAAGEYDLSVRIVPQDEELDTDGVFYIEGVESAPISLTKIERVALSGVSVAESRVAWEEIPLAEGYRIWMKGDDLAATEMTTTENSFDFANWLATETDGSFWLIITALGDGTNVLSSEDTIFTVATKAELSFSLSNADKKISWEADRAYPSYTYEIVDPDGETFALQQTEVCETDVLQFSKQGEYLLRVKPEAFIQSNDLYLKTGVEALDVAVQTFYKTQFITEVKNGSLYVRTLPALDGQSYTMTMTVTGNRVTLVKADRDSATGEWGYGPSYLRSLTAGTCSIGFSLTADDADFDSVFAFATKTHSYGAEIVQVKTGTATLRYNTEGKGIDIVASWDIPDAKYTFRYYISGNMREVTTKENKITVPYDANMTGAYVEIVTDIFYSPTVYYTGSESTPFVRISELE